MPARMASAPGMEYPEDPVAPRGPPTVPKGLSVPSVESSFGAVGVTPEKGSLPATSRTRVVVDPRAISNPTKTGMSDTFNVTHEDTPRDSLGGGMTWDPPSDDMRRPPPKHPPLVSPGGGEPGLPGSDRSETEKRETRIERRERERREEDERDRVARELRRTEEDRWRKLREDWRKEQEVMKNEREKWNKQREKFKKLQDEGKKLDSLKCEISTNEDYARSLHSRNADAEREVRCLLDQQVAAKADCVRIAEQRDGELQRLAEARVEGVREEDDRAARLWDLQDQIREAARRRYEIRDSDDGNVGEKRKDALCDEAEKPKIQRMWRRAAEMELGRWTLGAGCQDHRMTGELIWGLRRLGLQLHRQLLPRCQLLQSRFQYLRCRVHQLQTR